MANNHMPNDGESVVFGKPPKSLVSSDSLSPPVVQQQPPFGGSPSQGSLATTTSRPSTPATRPATTAATTNSEEMDINEDVKSPAPILTEERKVSTGQRVAEMCVVMGINPPSYVLEPSEEEQGRWNCSASFDDVRVPRSLGVVTGAQTKRAAKQMVAEAVLLWLEEEVHRRKELVKQMLA